MSARGRYCLAVMALAATACGVPDIAFYDDSADGASSSGDSSDAASQCPTALCCQSLPTPIPCIGAACAPSLCTAGQCDQCIGQVCCAKANGTTLCRADTTKCPP
jgi:hypothetical protein